VKNFTVAVIGAGNMGRALAAGMLKAKVVPASRLRVTDVKPEALKAFKAKYKTSVGTDNRTAAKGASAVLLCVKPQQMGETLAGLNGAIGPRQLVISVAAGVRIATIEDALGADVPVIRCMPNTPALYGAGATAFALGSRATAAHEKTAVKILSAVGRVWKLPEAQLDAVTALSGSGPAYAFHLAEAMAEAGAKLGLPAEVAEALARQTVHGAGLMLQLSPEPAATLRERVTSPGGTTAAALAVLGESGFKTIFERALSAACRRSAELSQR
jgi:pyrroline-5-carboxylate reductase